MRKMKILLEEDEYKEFVDLLYSLTYSDMPQVNNYILELVLKRIEEENNG